MNDCQFAWCHIYLKKEFTIKDMGHLNHLSVGMVNKAKEQGAKVVFTLHDFWMMCPRGQFLQIALDGGEPWKISVSLD